MSDHPRKYTAFENVCGCIAVFGFAAFVVSIVGAIADHQWWLSMIAGLFIAYEAGKEL